MRRLGPLYPGAVALRRSTAVGWPPDLELAGDDVRRSAPWMVALGAAIGVCGFCAGWLVRWLGAAPAVAGVISLAARTALGAAMLERGLVRHCDARWPGTGAVALATVVLVRAVTVLSIAPGAWLGALVVAPVVGRWCALGLQRLGEADAVDHGLGVGAVSGWCAAVVTAAVVVGAVVVLGPAGLIAVMAAAAAGYGVAVVARRRDGAIDGGALATAAVVGEIAVLIAAAAGAAATGSPFVT